MNMLGASKSPELRKHATRAARAGTPAKVARNGDAKARAVRVRRAAGVRVAVAVLLAACALAVAQDGMTIHTRRPGGGSSGGGRSTLRPMPQSYVARNPELKRMLEEEGAAADDKAAGIGAAAAPGKAEATAATAAITSGKNDKPKFTPEQMGLPGTPGDLSFLVHRCTNVKASTLKGVIEPFVSGDGTVEAATESDVVYVRDTPESLADIRRIIDHADRPQEQVMVEAQIVEIRLDKDFEKDIGLLIQKSGTFSMGLLQVLGVPGDSPYLGNLSDQDLTAGENWGTDRSAWSISRTGDSFNAGATVRFLEQRGRAKTLSNPKLTVRRGFKGQFLSGKEVPYYVYSDDSSSSSYAVQFKKVGIKLDVEPIMITCDTVRMVVAPEVSAIDGYTDPGSGENQYPRQPIVNIRNVQTEIEIKDGETIAIGGLFNTVDRKLRRGVPGLSSIPGVRHLFTSVHNVEERNQLVIFLTLKILQPGVPGGFVYPPTRDIPIRSQHDEHTHLQPKIWDGEPAHKWDNPEAILPPRRVEIEYMADGRIAWNNPNLRMQTNFPETPCPKVPLVDPVDFCDSEPPQKIREVWTKPGWPESILPATTERVVSVNGTTVEEGYFHDDDEVIVEDEEVVVDAGHHAAPVEYFEHAAPVEYAGEYAAPVAHYCGRSYCDASPCAMTPGPYSRPVVQDVVQTVGLGVGPCGGEGPCSMTVVSPAPMAYCDVCNVVPVVRPALTCGGCVAVATPVVRAAPECDTCVVPPVVRPAHVCGPEIPCMLPVPCAAPVVRMVRSAHHCGPAEPCTLPVPCAVPAPAASGMAPGEDCEDRGGYRAYPIITTQQCQTPTRGETTVFKDGKSDGTVVQPPPLNNQGPDDERRTSPALPPVTFGDGAAMEYATPYYGAAVDPSVVLETYHGDSHVVGAPLAATGLSGGIIVGTRPAGSPAAASSLTITDDGESVITGPAATAPIFTGRTVASANPSLNCNCGGR